VAASPTRRLLEKLESRLMGDARRQREPGPPDAFDDKRLPAESQADRMRRARAATEDAARQLQDAVNGIESGDKVRRARRRRAQRAGGSSGLDTADGNGASAATAAWLAAPPLDLSLKYSMQITSARPFDWLKRQNASKARAVGGFARCEPAAVELGDLSSEALAESFHQALCYWTFPATERLRVGVG
jgi:hypothetical protein